MVWIHGWLLSSQVELSIEWVVVGPGNDTTPESSLVQTRECSADCLQGASVQCNAGPDAAVRGCLVKSQRRVRASTRLGCRVEPPGQWGTNDTCMTLRQISTSQEGLDSTTRGR